MRQEFFSVGLTVMSLHVLQSECFLNVAHSLMRPDRSFSVKADEKRKQQCVFSHTVRRRGTFHQQTESD